MEVIAIDFETHLISEATPYPKPICLSWSKPDGTSGLEVGHSAMFEFLLKIHADYIIIAHNAQFELGVILAHFPDISGFYMSKIERKEIFCTLMAEKVLNNMRVKPIEKLGLAACVDRYFDIDIYESKGEDAWRTRYSELEGIPAQEWPKEAVDYAISDSVYARRIYNIQIEALHKEETYPEVLNNSRHEILLNIMAAEGMTLDPARSQQLHNDILSILEPLRLRLQEAGFMYYKESTKTWHKNNKKFIEHVSAVVPKKIQIKTTKGSLKVGKEFLEKYNLEIQDPIIDLFLKHVKYEKIITAFTPRLLGHSLIRTQYGACVRTGRSSAYSSKFYPSLNIQQMPRGIEGVEFDVRNCFIPRPGFKFVSIDYSGLELASVASRLLSLNGESEMADLLNSGSVPVDLHSMLATHIYNHQNPKEKIDYQTFLAKRKEKTYAYYRQLSKPVDLGYPGGMGRTTIRLTLAKEGIFTKYKVIFSAKNKVAAQYALRDAQKVSPYTRLEQTGPFEWSVVYDEVMELEKIFFGIFPDLGRFLHDQHKKFLTGSTIMTYNEFGQQEWEPTYKINDDLVHRNNVTYTVFANSYLMQAPSAVGAKNAIAKAVATNYRNSEIFPKAFIHDEIIFEIKDNDNLKYNVDKMAELMIDEMQSVLPGVRIAVEASVMDYWSKSGSLWDKSYWKNADKGDLKC